MGGARPWARVLTHPAHRRRPSPTEHPSLTTSLAPGKRVVTIAGEAAWEPDPGQNGNLRSLGKRPHLLEPLPPSELRTERGPIGLCPSSGGTYALAFFPSTPWTDAIGSFPSVGRRLGISHPICHRCLSVHLIDRLPARQPVKRRREGRKPFPLQRPVVSRMWERGRVLWIWSWMERAWPEQGVPGTINDTRAQRSGQTSVPQ
jgi:hypothetical protein